MIAALAVVGLLAALAFVKTFERHLPAWVVRAGLAVFVVGPLAGLGWSMWALWQRSLVAVDLVLFVTLAVITGLGTSLGYHRLLTHRSFKTTALDQGGGAGGGGDGGARAARSTGPPATSSTMPTPTARGIPHSPIDGLLARPCRLAVLEITPAKRDRYCRALMRDPTVMLIERTAVLWSGSGADRAGGGGRLARPAVGRLVRIAVHNHTMFAVNSVCHALDRSRSTGDRAGTTGCLRARVR